MAGELVVAKTTLRVDRNFWDDDEVPEYDEANIFNKAFDESD